ncbi:MAG: nickel pincer cofactor biosynthesis protein LarB [Dehalococcoidales bacterium]|nr:nickel pincer cofactor biosynthesis protein LarB [Dehalococcoidales bacterium]
MVNNKKPTKAADEWLTGVLKKVKAGKLTVNQALKELSVLPYEEMDFAKVDHHRNVRVGFPEVIFGRGKTVAQIVSIASAMSARSQRILVTHAPPEAFTAVKAKIKDASYNSVSRTIVVNRMRNKPLRPGITVITGGTADIPTAEEAAVTAELMGNKVENIFDIGVAGIHRMFENLPQIRKANVLIVVAGMEGALPGIICGLVSVPVIAVPTSVGYGASFNGLAPLLTMLNSCAPGIAVVNIDNGFGAGYLAGLINQRNNNTDENGK